MQLISTRATHRRRDVIAIIAIREDHQFLVRLIIKRWFQRQVQFRVPRKVPEEDHRKDLPVGEAGQATDRGREVEASTPRKPARQQPEEVPRVQEERVSQEQEDRTGTWLARMPSVSP